MSELKWLAIAKQSIGLAEVPGPKHNPTILKWLAQLKAWWKEDETPWCGTFVAHCLQDAGYAIAKNWFRALGWKDWGKVVSPQLGAVMIFGRQGGGHVAFYIGEDAGRYYVLGGNQGNKVGYTWIAKDRLVACRWPAEVPVPNTGRVMLAANGQATSTNEA